MLILVAAPSAPSPESRHHSKRRTRTSIPNSSDHNDDDDDDTIEVEIPKRPSSVRRVLKEVSIPAMTSPKPGSSTRGRRSKMQAQSAEQDSSNGSPSMDNSDYETAGTSISTTPAASIRRGTASVSARKSRLSKAANMSLSRSSSLKRSRNTVAESDEEYDVVDADAELALQIQMEENEAMHASKRLKINSDDDDDIDSWEADMDLVPDRIARSYRGKGKAKVEEIELVDDVDDDDSIAESLTPPTYQGKGKGKVEAETRARNHSRSVRSSTKKAGSRPDDILDSDMSEGEEFQPDDVDSVLSELSTPPLSDSDEEPLMAASSRLKKLAKQTSKPSRGKKKKSLADEVENKKRRARWAHIEDKWERKRAMNRERAEQQHPKLLSMWKDLERIPILETQTAEQPTSISRRLKPFQLEGLSWMVRQEKTHYRGGLLGDEMGMGKTIQAVSLIMSDYPAKEPTLVCVPPVALMQWSNEIREYTDNKLKVLVYHGTNAKCKKMSIKELRSYDVIMVSYNSLESLHRKETKGWSRGEDIVKEASPLHAIKFHRLILDEAHSIKSRNTGVAKACFALQGNYKWCLSGTPVQNRIGEFFSLLRFLEVRPFADYFCRSCDCEKLHWATDDDHMCVACNHGASEHISVFNQELLNPITGDDPELREDALTKLHMITARIMLRRMKRDHTNSMVCIILCIQSSTNPL
jgi:DNA repair protein RAD16